MRQGEARELAKTFWKRWYLAYLECLVGIRQVEKVGVGEWGDGYKSIRRKQTLRKKLIKGINGS